MKFHDMAWVTGAAKFLNVEVESEESLKNVNIT
jgi:hypothetical protein